MDPLTLAALISLVGAGGSALATSNAASTSAAGLGFQEQQAAQAQKLGTAGHTDALGDTQTYNPATNTWSTTLSPEQQAISDAQQSDNLQAATTGAARQRAIANVLYQNAQGAQQDYNTNLAGLRYDQPDTQGALADKLTTLMTNADNNMSSSNESLAARTLLRQGRGSDLGQLIKNVQDARGQKLATDELNAYTGSQQLEGTLQQQHQSKYLPGLQEAQNTIAAGGGAPPANIPGVSAGLSAGQQQDSAQALNALLTSGSQVSNAFNALSTAEDKQAPNLSGIAALYKAGLTQPKTPTPAAAAANTDGSSYTPEQIEEFMGG